MAADRRVRNCGDSKAYWNPVYGCPGLRRTAAQRSSSASAGTMAPGKQAGLADARRNSDALSSGAPIRGQSQNRLACDERTLADPPTIERFDCLDESPQPVQDVALTMIN